MSDEEHDVVFTEPIYSSDYVANRTDHAIRSRRPRHGSIDSAQSGARRIPSLVAQESRHKASDSSQPRSSSITSFTIHEEDCNAPKTFQHATQKSRGGSDFSSRATTLRGSVDTHDALTNFAPIAAEHMRKEKERDVRLQKHSSLPSILEHQLEALRGGHKRPSWFHSILPWIPARGLDVGLDELKHLAKFHFPYRSDVKVFITDYKEHSAQSQECRLSEITKYMSSKPSDVQVRWIHAPLGLGPLHSTVEDLFLHQGVAGRPFKNLGRAGWPYAKVEVLNFCDRGRFQDMRDVYRFLHGNTELTKVLNQECWYGFEPSWKTEGNGLLDDLMWRTAHLGLSGDWQTLPDYWTASTSDIPWQITEGPLMPNYGPLDGLQRTLWQSDKQALHKHSFFESAQLVRDPFRCFHRGDGFLLTLSPLRGVNYIDRNFTRHLKEPGDAIFDNDVASAIAFVRQQFNDCGTQKWHRPTVEWLLIHLVTEIGVTPHTDRQGGNAPEIAVAYGELIQQFKRRRDDHFDRKDRDEPAELIKDMLICKDELRRMTIMSKLRRSDFDKLLADVKEFEAEDLKQQKMPEHEHEVSAPEMVQRALERTERQTEVFGRLFEDICMSLDAVYDLRSIQQRQGGIITEGQNRALVLITLVQLVFIPFTTLCGYWGMNLTDIRNSSWAQHDFWRVCASIVLTTALSSTLLALMHMLWRRQQSLRREYERGARVFTGPANDRLDGNVV